MMQMIHPVMLLIRLKLIVYFSYRLANIKLVWGLCLPFVFFYLFFSTAERHFRAGPCIFLPRRYDGVLSLPR
jgi:hypothetical protein